MYNLSKKEIVAYVCSFLVVLGVFLLLNRLITRTETVEANEGFLRYEDLKMYDHDIQTKAGGFLDLWNDSKRQDERVNNMRKQWHEGQQYDNQRIQDLQEQIKRLLGKKQQPPREVVAMISNEGGQSFLEHNPLIRRTKSVQDQELFEIVKQAGEVYRTETGRHPSCSIAGTQTTLETIIQRKIIQEGGYEVGSAGRRTNNPGSLRNSGVLREVVAFHNIDNTNKWREYATMQDGLIDLMYVIDQKYKCSISINSIFAYVYGPRAERTKERMDHVRAIFNNFYQL